MLTDNEKEGFPITALRELKILQLLHNENVVHMIEVCTSKRKFIFLNFLYLQISNYYFFKQMYKINIRVNFI